MRCLTTNVLNTFKPINILKRFLPTNITPPVVARCFRRSSPISVSCRLHDTYKIETTMYSATQTALHYAIVDFPPQSKLERFFTFSVNYRFTNENCVHDSCSKYCSCYKCIDKRCNFYLCKDVSWFYSIRFSVRKPSTPLTTYGTQFAMTSLELAYTVHTPQVSFRDSGLNRLEVYIFTYCY